MKIVIIGYGHMGQLYGQALCDRYDDHPLDARLVGVAEIGERAYEQIAAREEDITIDRAYDSLIAKVNPDAIILSTPAVTHCPLVCDLLRYGLPILVEKPVTGRVLDAECLSWRVERDAKAPVVVGHIERYNPTINEALERLQDGEVQQAVFTRITTLPERILDVGVTMDLMIHDLDILATIWGTSPEMVTAIKRTSSRPITLNGPGTMTTILAPARTIETEMMASLWYGNTHVILRAAWEDHKETSIALSKGGRYLRADAINHHIDFFRHIAGPLTVRPTKVNKLKQQLRDFLFVAHGGTISQTRLATVNQGAEAVKLAAGILHVAIEEGV